MNKLELIDAKCKIRLEYDDRGLVVSKGHARFEWDDYKCWEQVLIPPHRLRALRDYIDEILAEEGK